MANIDISDVLTHDEMNPPNIATALHDIIDEHDGEIVEQLRNLSKEELYTFREGLLMLLTLAHEDFRRRS